MKKNLLTQCLQETELAVHALPIDPVYKTFSSSITRTKLPYLGTKMPDLNHLVRQGFSFYTRTDKEILCIWDHIWKHATSHDAMNLPLIYYRSHQDKLTKDLFPTLKRWFDRVESWGHSDQFCQIYSILYERFPKTIEPTLFQWNRDKNPWKQRASIVSTIYYASKNRKPPSRTTVLELVTPLLESKDPYIQKAVGWQLREAYKLWPKQILTFLHQHATHLSAISFSYATEKLTKDIKVQLKERRKMYRQTK